MDYQGFLTAVQDLNNNSYFYGNQVLYKMAAESHIEDQDQLAGMMWLIGRSYAASPQRRSYAKKWPVRSDNDGRDQFFSYVANALKLPNLLAKDDCIRFKTPNEDIKLLTDSIRMVLQFNLSLSKAIEKFDNAPDGIHCTNHISFCSKFLHFYYRNAVFIIDSYAQAGATHLFGGYNANKLKYICEPVDRNTDYFDETVYKQFPKKKANDLEKCIEGNLADVLAQYKDRKQENAKAYVKHCVRSYLLGCKLKEEKVIPSAQLAGEKFQSMPRLVDTVFLNIKGKGKENLPKEI